jgi:tripartite-type tricarboxylate transporter receptor subunit TctC
MSPTISRRALLSLGTLAALAPAAALAQDFPGKPLRLVVPQAAGTGNDVLARSLADLLATELGQPVVVENRPGANGGIAAQAVLAHPADGTTLLFSGVSNLSWTPLLYPGLKYQPARDFSGVALLANTPFIMVTGAASPFRTLADVVQAAKAQPGTVNFASYGVGNSTHLATELFADRAGLLLHHIPFSGAAATTSVVSGEVGLLTTVPGGVRALLQGGKLRALAVTGTRRLAAFPDVPTFKEAGFDIEVPGWYSIVARAGTPPALLEQLNRRINRVVASAGMQARLADQSLDAMQATPAELDRLIVRDSQAWAPLIKKLNIVL